VYLSNVFLERAGTHAIGKRTGAVGTARIRDRLEQTHKSISPQKPEKKGP